MPHYGLFATIPQAKTQKTKPQKELPLVAFLRQVFLGFGSPGFSLQSLAETVLPANFRY